MRVKILRKEAAGAPSFWQEFECEAKPNQTVAGLLEALNGEDELKDVNGTKVSRIDWECSCLQGMCGACAMVINGEPALACEVFLRDLKGDVVTVEPLRKFPVIRDLRVDRSIIYENLREANAYIEEYEGSDPKEHDHQYAAGKCLKCGLCLEVCSNYRKGEKFYGAAFANDCYLINTRSSLHKDEIRESYKEHFASGCSKALSCIDVCPMKIPTLASMAKLNRK